jgi:hypothetical protein
MGSTMSTSTAPSTNASVMVTTPILSADATTTAMPVDSTTTDTSIDAGVNVAAAAAVTVPTSVNMYSSTKNYMSSLGTKIMTNMNCQG